MRIAFFGAGAWGTALAHHASSRHEVLLVARSAEQAEQIRRDRCNRRYLPEIALRDDLNVSHGFAVALDWLAGSAGSLAVFSCAMSGLPDLVEHYRRYRAADHRSIATPAAVVPIVWLSKGLIDGAGQGPVRLPHELFAERLPGVPAAPLLGPSFALEVARGLPAALTVACTDNDLASRTLTAFHFEAIRIYRSDDVVGVEVGGALKNVVAIATGICDGLALGMNARAALVTRGLAEITRLGVAMGANAETFMGLTGLGDLVLTATGDLSRNRKVGLELARGVGLPMILESLGHVAEGVASVEAALRLAAQHGVELPICAAVAAVLRGQISAAHAVQRLLSREPTREQST